MEWRKKRKAEGRRKCHALLSPLKVTEMPGHLLCLHQIKRTLFQKNSPTHYRRTSVFPTALSTTDFPACLWWLRYRCTRFFCSLFSLSFDDHTFNKNRNTFPWRNVCASRWHASKEFLGHDITRSQSNWIQCKIVLSLQKLKSIYTNTPPDILEHNIMRLWMYDYL